DVSDWLKCEFMQDHVGDNFTGVISTVTNFGLFVRLQDLHIEGLVHITSLGRDFYHYDDVRMCLTGEQSGKKYRVGDEIRVQVAAVNLDEKKIDLRLEGSEVEENQGQFKGKSKGKSKSTSARHSGSKVAEGKSVTKTENQATTAKKDKPKSKPKGSFKAESKVKPKAKSKAKKRSVRKKRPGKNARKSTENDT
ncbi:MAG: ribonuclease R, partial [Flavobacteriales bacterium]